MSHTEERNEAVVAANKEISAKELLLRIQAWIRYIASKWMIIILFAGIGIAISLWNRASTKVQYIADCTFTLDENGAGGNSAMASGGLALLGLGSGSAEGGLFQGKNLMWLYSSRQMLETSLLTPADSGGRLFVDWFFTFDKEGKKIRAKDKTVFKRYNDSLPLSRDQNALMGFVIGRIKSKYLTVTETKNTENFITVSIKAEDEQFAKEFSDVLVATVNNFYVESKTQKIRNEIAVLQRKTEDYQGEMNSSMVQTAQAIDATPYPNVNQQVLQVASQKKGVGVRVNSELYVEMVKALEANKMTLAKETPLIQVIDEPLLPLPSIQTPLFMAAIYGAVIGAFIIIALLTVIRLYKEIMSGN